MKTDTDQPVSPRQNADRLYTLRNATKMTVTVSERGAALISWLAPDRDGHVAEILLGYPDACSYVENNDYFGAIIGRWANRIRNGQFLLDGVLQQVGTNDRGNLLHGGLDGFHRSLWQVVESESRSESGSGSGSGSNSGLLFRLRSPDGDGGFSGNLDVTVNYQLHDDGSLVIDYKAVSDAPTAINLTSHPYFNLNGGGSDIGDHILQINADRYMEIDRNGLAVNEANVAGTAFDFRQPAPIGARLARTDAQIQMAGGFDHYYCVSPHGRRSDMLREVARVVDPGSGRQLQVSSTEAGLQFYSGNALDGVPGKSGHPYGRYAGFCLEAHACPDQINSADAADVILRPGQVYRQTTVYRIGLQE